MGEEEIITGPAKSKVPTAIKVILGLVLLLVVVVLIAYVISSKSDCNKPISQDGYIIDNSIIPSSIAEGVDQQAISGVQCAFAYPETTITGSCAIGGSPYTLNGCTADPCYNVRCEPSNDCKIAGTCINGTCSAETNKPDNTQCGDGSTAGDVCISGVCGGCVAPTSQRGYNITSITPSSIDYIFGGGAPQPVNGVTCDADAGWSRITDVEDPLFRLAHPDAGIPITGTCSTSGSPYILSGCEQVSNPGADAMTQRPGESSAEFYRRRTETGGAGGVSVARCATADFACPPATSECKIAGTCTGIGGTCGPETPKPNGTACGPGAQSRIYNQNVASGPVCRDGLCGGDPSAPKNCKDDFDVSNCPAQFQEIAATVIRSNPNTLDNISCAGDTCLASECCPECLDRQVDSWYASNSATYDGGPNDLRYRPVADGGCPIPSGGVCKAVKCTRGMDGLEMPTCDSNEENKPDGVPCTDGAISGLCYGGLCQPVKWIRGESDETCTQTCSGATDLSGQPMTCQDGDWGVHDPVTMRRVLEQVENLPAGISSSCPLQGGSSDTQEGRRIRQSYSLTVLHGGYDMLELLPGIAVNSLNCLYDWDRPRTGRRGGVSSCDGSPQDIGAPHYNRLCKCVNV